METYLMIEQPEDWLVPILRWVESSVGPDGCTVTGHKVLRGSSESGCLVNFQTTSGGLYFKAVSEFMTYEPKLVSVLSQLYPLYFPEIICADEERRWVLMREVNGELLGRVSDISRWKEALQAFARIQIDSAKHFDTLLTLGCPDWRLDKLTTEIDVFFEFVTGLECKHPKAFSYGGKEKLHKLAPVLKEKARQLACCGIPPSLVHGDFHLENILMTETGCVYLDWAEGYLGPPFFVIADFLAYIGYMRQDLRDEISPLRDAYLDAWARYGNSECLLRAFEISRPLAVLRYAMRVTQSNLSLGSMRSEDEEGLAKYLNSLIQHVCTYAGALSLVAH